MKPNTLRILSSNDWDLLSEHLRATSFQKGATLISEGQRSRALYFLRKGVVRVEQSQNGRGIALALIGPGEMFGEMGFIEGTPASASIIAEDETEVDMVNEEALQSLMAAEPGFAVRFYQSIASAIAARLAATSRRLTQMGAQEVLRGESMRTLRTGNISPRQIPEDLSIRVEAFEREMLTIKQELRTRRLPEAEAQTRISAAIDGVFEALQTYTESAPIAEIGWSDLLAFRDPDQLVDGVGDLVFRETFPTLMLSAVVARCYVKQRGYPDDFETTRRIYDNDPEGDDWLGPFIDRWFLNRPICRTRRASRDLMRDWLLAALANITADARPHVVSLASGAAAELLDVMTTPQAATLHATCYDLDAQALFALLERAESAGVRDRLTVVQANVAPATGASIPPLPAHVVYGLALGEYLDDEQFVRVLDSSFEALVDRGSVILTNLSSGNPDRDLMEHVLDWKVIYRDEESLRALFARSRFADRSVDFGYDDSRTTLFARCRKI
jgi:CRP-like cAMP-binding protein